MGHLIAIALGALGVGIIGRHDLSASSDALRGDALALVGCAAMAGYLLLGRRVGPALDVLGFTGVATLVGGGALAATSAAAGIPFAVPTAGALGYLVLAALVPQLIGHSLLTWSLRHVRPTVVGIATIGEPVGSTALGWLWLGEPADVALGCLVTLAAVIVALRGRGGRRSAPRTRT